MEDGPLPATAADIDAAWLTEALALRYPGVRVASVDVVWTAEATNAHARLHITYEEAAGAPATVFCKLPPRDDYRRGHIIESGMGRKEAYFYRDLAPTLQMRTPAVHFSGYDESNGTFLLMVEDLSATGCAVSDGTWGVSPDSAAGALEDLAQLHLRFEDERVRATEAGWVVRRKPGNAYGTTLLQVGLDNHRDRLSDQFAEISQLYIDHDVELSHLWLDGPTTLIHGDPHIGNLFDDNGRTGFFDWGLITLSTPLRDVSYFLNMAMQPDDRRAHEADLLRHYLDVKNAGGTTQPFTFDQAWLTHRLHAAYTVVACCQIVTFPENATERRRTFANAFLARSEAAIADLDSRAALKEVAGL